jgi:riboflavin biosynthesis pyrimidine reductase
LKWWRSTASALAAIGDEADLETLLELRTLADAVLIGTGTVRAESSGGGAPLLSM